MDTRVNKIIDLIENTVDEVSLDTLQSYREKRLKEPLDKRTPTKTKGIQRSYTKMMYKINKDDKGTFGDTKGYDQGRYMGDSVEEDGDDVEESMVARVQGGRKMVSAEAALRHARELAQKRQPGSKPTLSDIAHAHRNLTSGIKHESEENESIDESFAVKDSSGKTVDVKFSESEAKKRAEELSKKTGQKHSVKFERTAMVRTVKEDTDGKDTVTLEIPALIRALEWAREDAEDDVEIHKFVEKLINHEGTVDMNFFSEGVVPSADRKIDRNGRPYPAHQVHIGTNESETLKVGETVWAKDQKLSYKTHTGKILSISKETVTIKLNSGATQTFPKKAVSSDFETLNPNPSKRADESIEESKVSSTYEISYDYGPHMSKTVSISANSEKEAEKEVIRTAAKEGHRNIMINWIRKDARQSIQRGTNAK